MKDINVDNLLYTHKVLQAETSLYEFLKQAWHIIDPMPFQDMWHLRVIAEHLEACFRRDITRLIINVPPRTGKTTLVSIVFPAWVWIHSSHEQFMYVSYGMSLSLEHSQKCRELIESPWYQKRWGKNYQLSKAQNAKEFFRTNKNGHRFSTSIDAIGTGKGGSMLIADDPNNMRFVHSKAIRDSVNNWLSQTAPTRLNDPQNDVRIIVMQRGHYDDATGHTLSKDINKKWVHLNLPVRFEMGTRCSTIVLPSTNGKVWQDPRTEEKELLCPKRMPKNIIEEYENELGSYTFAAQYQQRPSPEGGGIFKTSWFKWWKSPEPPKIEFVLQSWDTAYSKKDTAAYSACTTWGVFYDKNDIENVILLSAWRDRVEYPELRAMAKRLYFDYRDTGKVRNHKLTGRPLDLMLIEAKATGDPLIKDLALASIRALPFNPTGHGTKEGRAHFVTPLIEGGRVWLPAQDPDYHSLLPFAGDFLEAAACFPSLASNDIIDTMTQALIKLKDGFLLRPPQDERQIFEPQEEIKMY